MEALPDFSLLAVALPMPGQEPQALAGVSASPLGSVPQEGPEAAPLSAFQALLPILLQAAEGGKALPVAGNALPFSQAPTQPNLVAPAPLADLPGLPVLWSQLAGGSRPGQSSADLQHAQQPSPVTPRGDVALDEAPAPLAELVGRGQDRLPASVELATQADLESTLPNLPRFMAAGGGRRDSPQPALARAGLQLTGNVDADAALTPPRQLAPPLAALSADKPAPRPRPVVVTLEPNDLGGVEFKPGTSTPSGVAQVLAPQGADGLARPAQLGSDLPVAPGHPRFGDEVIQRIRVMVADGVSQARLRINPPELGSLEIRISVVEDRATVHFAASHATAREALEAGLPRLRELLGAAGLELADGHVSQGDGSSNPRSSSHAMVGVDLTAEVTSPAAEHPVPLQTAPPPGRIDLYA